MANGMKDFSNELHLNGRGCNAFISSAPEKACSHEAGCLEQASSVALLTDVLQTLPVR